MSGRGGSLKRIWILSLVFVLLLGIISAGNSGDSKVDEKIVGELSEKESVKVIVVLKEEVDKGIFSAAEKVEVNEVAEDLRIEKEKEFSSVKGFSSEVDAGDLEKLVRDERVERVEYDYPISLFLQDSVDLINVSVVHTLDFGLGNITGRNQTVCVIDTGVNYSHLDLGGCFGEECKVVGGYDFVNDDIDPIDDNGHGTHVAGIVAANGNIMGVAPNASLISIKVLNDGGEGYISDAILGIEWCTNNASLFNISVISMSLGTSGTYSSSCDGVSEALTNAINSAVENNISVIAAAGNAGNSTGISLPACIENVTAIGWSTKDDEIAFNSNRNGLVSLFAPGSIINSTNISGSYEEKSGTSMATPHVAGVIALLRQYYSDGGLEVSVATLVQELKETGKPIFDSESGLTFYRVDAYNALADNATPVINITLSGDVLELDQQNLTILVSYTDAFLDAYNASVNYPNETLLSEFQNSLELTTENLTELGTYTITAWANDSNGNENLTTKTFLVRDITGLSENSFTFNNLEGNNNFTDQNLAFFNVTIGSKYNLANATLYHNATGWEANETLDLDTNETTVVFNASFAGGIYDFGIKTCDVNNYCVFSENKTLYVDLSEPIVRLYSPNNRSTITALPIDFTFNVSDYGIESCVLTLNDVENETLSSVSIGENNVFTENIYYLSDGDYNWSVKCSDKVGRVGVSDVWGFTLSCESDWSRSCGVWSECSGGSKTRLCYDDHYCTSASNNISSTSGCEEDSGTGGTTTSPGGGETAVTTTDKSVLKFQANAGDEKSFSISKDVGISGLEMKFKKAVTSVEISVEKQTEKPSAVSAVENVYRYIKISSNLLEDDLAEAKINFKVPKSWILINALNDPTKVYLSRYSDGKWGKLETLTAGVDGDYQKYEAVTPGFSYFAISADKGLITAGAGVVGGEGNETGNETELEVEEGGVEESWVSRFTGWGVKVFKSGGRRYYYISGVIILLLVLGYLGFRLRKRWGFSKLKFFPKIGSIFSKFKKVKVVEEKIREEIKEESKEIKNKFKKHHRDKITKEKEKLEREREELEKEREEVERLKAEEEKEKEKEEKERRRREEELEKKKRREEKEREEEEREEEKEREKRLKEEKKKVKKEKKEKVKEKKKLKEKKEEGAFEIKHGEEERWEDFELEDFEE